MKWFGRRNVRHPRAVTHIHMHVPPMVVKAPKPLKFSMAEFSMALEAVKMKSPPNVMYHV